MAINDPKHAWLNEEIGTHLAELSVFFKPHYRLTFVARNLDPADGDADVVVSDDSMAMVIQALGRRIEVDGDQEPAEPAIPTEQENKKCQRCACDMPPGSPQECHDCQVSRER